MTTLQPFRPFASAYYISERGLSDSDIPSAAMLWEQELEQITGNRPVEWMRENAELGITLFISPFLHYIDRCVRQDVRYAHIAYCMSDQVRSAAWSGWTSDLRQISDRVIVFDFHSRRESEPSLTLGQYLSEWTEDATEYEAILQRYPVMARALMEQSIRAARNWMELMERFVADEEQIGLTLFGGDPVRLQSIVMNAGDCHQDGRTVTLLHCDNGETIVYKPRSLQSDLAFGQWLRWLEENGLQDAPSAALTINRGEYGWQRYIHHRPCESEEQVKRYYYRAGVLGGIFHLFQSTDMHYENIVACGDMPCVIDLETVMANSVFRKDGMPFPTSELQRTIMTSGLFPTGQLFQSRIDFDLSGIAGKPDQVSTNMTGWTLTNNDSEQIRYEKTSFVTTHDRHLVVWNGETVNPVHYLDDMLQGLESVYSIFMQHQDELFGVIAGIFSGTYGRALMRPTFIYGRFLLASFHPNYMSDGVKREKLLNMLWNMTKAEPAFEHIAGSEIADLLRNDIPYFTFPVDGTSLVSSAGDEVADMFGQTSLADIGEQIKRLSPQDLALQKRLLSASLHTNEIRWMEAPAVEAMRERGSDDVSSYSDSHPLDPLAEARFIADHLVEQAITNEQFASWIGIRIRDEKFDWQALDFSLYSGIAGIAMFLGQMYAETNEQVYRDTAVKAFRYISSVFDKIRDQSSPSVFNGIGSVVYAGFYLSQLFPYSEARHCALGLLDTMQSVLHAPPGQKQGSGLTETEPFADYLDGYAGVVTLCLNLWEESGERKAYETAIAYARRLVHYCESTPPHLTGFAHGSSGLLYALRKLERIGWQDGKGVRIRLEQFEASMFDSKKLNWRDLREHAANPYQSHYWCHGAPGVLLGMTAVTGELCLNEQPANLDELMDAVMQSTLAQPRLSLCHGLFGNLDILLELRKTGWGRRYDEAIERCCEQSLHRQDIRSLLSSMRHKSLLSLMLGTAGVGWTMLRLHNRSVPSLLTLSFPERKGEHVFHANGNTSTNAQT